MEYGSERQLPSVNRDAKQAWALEQQSYVRDLPRRSGRFGVTGTAGSGKTIIAIETARWLAKQGHRTLVTCFNKRLASHLAASTAELEGRARGALPRAGL